jgi:hypothetical protein
MLTNLLGPVLICAGIAAAAEPLPELRTEATNAGSIFHIRNAGSQPLTAYLIELVNYPGSYFALWQDDPAGPLAPGAEKEIHTTNMIVGAAPDYVKLQAAIYADGSSAGIPDKVAMILDRRKAVLATTRELIAKLEKPGDKANIVAGLKQWADSLQPQGKNNRTQAAVNQAASRSLVEETAGQLDRASVEQVLSSLKSSEERLASSKPAL